MVLCGRPLGALVAQRDECPEQVPRLEASHAIEESMEPMADMPRVDSVVRCSDLPNRW
jgi:hypothetical protein